MFQVRAAYDFNGEGGTDEMSIITGEVLTVTRTDVGIGWWEGKNQAGQTGLFPESYVECMTNVKEGPSPINLSANDHQTSEEWDDDWDEDTYSEIPANTNSNQSEQLYSNECNDNLRHIQHMDSFPESFNVDNKGTVSKKSLNRFSSFVKSGGESYLLGQVKSFVPEESKIHIIKLEETIFAWPKMQNSYTVLVASPKKETKLKGLKSFIAYQLTPSFNNIQVSRRYKHFDWLQERLADKFCLFAVPPLPDKQISGRYEEQFIEHRRAQLQEFVDYVCRHPVMSLCDVWQHFLTCTDDKLWKLGKRQAEKDSLVGANFCLCIEAPEKTLLPSVADGIENEHVQYIINLDNGVKNMLITATDQSKKYRALYSKENIKIGESFYILGTAIEGNKAVPCKLSGIVKRIGASYTEIGKLYEKQFLNDWYPLGDKLYLYKGITNSFQSIFSIAKGAQTKRKECEKTLSGTALNDVKKRSDVLTYTTIAELNHFQNERDTDLKAAMKKYIEEQINFYKEIVNKLEGALNEFD